MIMFSSKRFTIVAFSVVLGLNLPQASAAVINQVLDTTGTSTTSTTDTAAYLRTHAGVTVAVDARIGAYSIALPQATGSTNTAVSGVCVGDIWSTGCSASSTFSAGSGGKTLTDLTWKSTGTGLYDGGTGLFQPVTNTIIFGSTNANSALLSGIGGTGVVEAAQATQTPNRAGSQFGATAATGAGGSNLITGRTDLLANGGIWNSALGGYIASNAAAPGSLYLYFSTPIAGFSALFDYDPASTYPPTLSALNATRTLISGNTAQISPSVSSFTASSYNSGYVLGFLDSTNDISFIKLSGASYAAMSKLSIAYVVNAPEPMTLVLLGSGLVGIGLVRRRLA